MKENRIINLLENLDQLTPQEREELNQWYQSFDQKPDDSHLVRLLLDPQPTQQRLLQKIQIQTGQGVKIKRLHYLKIAASILLFFSLAGLILWNLQSTSHSVNERLSGIGELRHFQLEDGTEIWLNSKSKLLISENFGQEDREVTLEGEAFLKVHKDPTKPFRVITGNVTTTVLGTEFNVRAYPNEKSHSVALMEGSVSLSSGEVETLLEPGEKATFGIHSTGFVIQGFTVLNETAWMDKQLVFEATPLQEIAQILNRKYGIEVQFAEEDLKELEFTGKFKDEDLSIILTAIVRAHGLKFQAIDSQVIEIYKKK